MLTGKPDAALGGSFPAAISLHTRAVSPRNENGKLAPQNLHSKTNCIGGAFTALKACVEYLLTADLLRRINSMDKPNGRLVLVSYAHYCASTSSLSTRWSSWALLFPFGLGDLILGRASRLYAFSGYHNRTSLPSRAIGMTTGTPGVCTTQSSRTRVVFPQNSCAHDR